MNNVWFALGLTLFAGMLIMALSLLLLR